MRPGVPSAVLPRLIAGFGSQLPTSVGQSKGKSAMAINVDVLSTLGSDLDLVTWFSHSNPASPQVTTASEFRLFNDTDSLLGGAIKLKLISDGNDFTYNGNELTGGTITRIIVNADGPDEDIIEIHTLSFDAADFYAAIVQAASNNTFALNQFFISLEYAFNGNKGADVFKGFNESDKINGGEGNDVLSGSYGLDTIKGQDGDDTLNGGHDGDILEGGEGNDILSGGLNNDVLKGGNGDDTLFGGAFGLSDAGTGTDTLDGGDGFDTVSYAGSPGTVTINLNSVAQGSGAAAFDLFTSIEKFIGSDGNDQLVGNADSIQFDGGQGKDFIAGGSGDNWITGGAGADTLDGQGGIDMLSYLGAIAGVTVAFGAAGTETTASGGDAQGDKIKNFENVIGGDGNDTLTGNGLANVMVGLGGNDVIKAMGGNDRLIGGEDKDNLDGGEGNDRVVGGGDADTLSGGGGVDLLDYNEFKAGVTVTLGANGAQTTANGGDAQDDKISLFENVRGSAFDDTLTGTHPPTFSKAAQEKTSWSAAVATTGRPTHPPATRSLSISRFWISSAAMLKVTRSSSEAF